MAWICYRCHWTDIQRVWISRAGNCTSVPFLCRRSIDFQVSAHCCSTITLPQDTAFTLLHILLVYYWPSIWLAPHHWASYALFTLDLSSNINGSVGVEKEVIPLNPRISILLLKPTCHYMPDVTAMQCAKCSCANALNALLIVHPLLTLAVVSTLMVWV